MKSIARTNRVKKGHLATESTEHAGLCNCCVNFSICSYEKNYGQPAMYCEEFTADDEQKAGSGVLTDKKVTKHEWSHADSLKGLCATCKSGRNCNLSEQAGGVWQCEEYR